MILQSSVLIPSVALYSGQVPIGLKEGTFEPSSPLRHMSELRSLIESEAQSKPVLFLYIDGGPDHRLAFLRVQLSLIALFLCLDLDYVCAAQTAPYCSWRNPVERIMSIVNLGLQCVGLARQEMDDENERLPAKAGNMKELRNLLAKHPGFEKAVLDSVESVRIQLVQIPPKGYS